MHNLPQPETAQSACLVSFREQRGKTFIFIFPSSINNYSSLDLNKKSPTDMGSEVESTGAPPGD